MKPCMKCKPNKKELEASVWLREAHQATHEAYGVLREAHQHMHEAQARRAIPGRGCEAMARGREVHGVEGSLGMDLDAPLFSPSLLVLLVAIACSPSFLSLLDFFQYSPVTKEIHTLKVIYTKP
uniref:Uncharacterized protein n=1 Tax=Arachis duranensis TaxID=130453 RepID=N1NJK7_ARADU|nr:hypothetical protein ARAX_ADH079023-072J06-005 [Arachis duranensis]